MRVVLLIVTFVSLSLFTSCYPRTCATYSKATDGEKLQKSVEYTDERI